MTDLGLEALSKTVTFTKYAKYIPELKRRESWEEIVDRYTVMMMKKYPQLRPEILKNSQFILDKKVLPSMRALQFAGPAIETNPARAFNCCFLPIDSYHSFSETMFLLLGGTGVGYSVQKQDVEKLLPIVKPTKERNYLIEDSIMGWADAVKVLMKSYMCGKPLPKFDFSAIREKGARLVTAGGKAPGPEPLKICLQNIKTILDRKKDGDKLTPLECHDILCHIANSVLAGGIRRSALICLFSDDDLSMIECKSSNISSTIISKEHPKYTSKNGLEEDITKYILTVKQGDIIYKDVVLHADSKTGKFFDLDQYDYDQTLGWWVCNEQRGRSNNSAVLKRGEYSKENFLKLWKKIENSGSGEPGIYWTNNTSWGTNPCCFTADTKILTPTGYVKIGDNVGSLDLINKDGEIINGSIWSNGFKDVVEVKGSQGFKVRCTSDHRFMLSTGEECQAKDLVGKRIMPYFSINKEINEFVKYGFIQGDGGLGRLDSISHKGLEVNIGDKDDDIIELFEVIREVGKRSYYLNGFNEVLRSLQFDTNSLPNRGFPKTFNSWLDKDKLMFLKGMYSANGSIIKSSRISYKTTSKALSEQLLDTLTYFGISAYITTNKEKEVEFSNGNYTCKESYDINICKYESVIRFAELIGFVHLYKQVSLSNLIKEKAPKISSVKSTGSEEVFDFNLDDDTHWGVVEGVVVHNCEIALRPFQFCNLCEINVDNITSQEDLNERAIIAGFFGTLQAGFTKFHYLRPIWQKTTEKDALLGVGMTGIGSGKVLKYNLQEAVDCVKAVNKEVSAIIGTNEAARTACVKPAGTTSCVLKCSSGIHAWHDDYYLRTLRFNMNEDIAKFFLENHPEFCELDAAKPKDTLCVRFPIKAPEGSIFRTETALDTLERVKKFSLEWVRPGHNNGDNTHNVSATISIDKSRLYDNKDEWEVVGEWMWNNQEFYNGLSVLPYFGGTYKQAPFETITKEEYELRSSTLKDIDLTRVIEEDDLVDFSQTSACASGNCEINV